MRRHFEFVTSHPILTLTLAALITVILGPFVLTLDRDTSPDAFIPSDHQALALKRQVDESFGLADPIAVAVIRDHPGGVFTTRTLTLIRDLTGAIQRLPGIDPDDVISIATESGVYFDEDGLPGFERLLRDIPSAPAELEALKNDILGYELYEGTILAADGSAACILIRPTSEPQADAIYRGLAELLDQFPTTDERLVIAGEAAVRAYMGTAVSDDALRMNFICPVVIAFLIIMAYRTLRGTVLPLCVIGGASTIALGSMAVAHVPVYIVTNGIFVIIMALGVADSLHLIGQYYEEQLDLRGRDKRRIIVDACMALWYPLLTTSLTDVAGFFALYLAGIMPPIRYFGLFTCAGVLGALLFSYTVVPAGLAVCSLKMSPVFLRRKTAQKAGRLDLIGRTLGDLGSGVFSRPRLVLTFGILVIIAAGAGASRLTINDARILAFKDDHPLVQATGELNRRFDGTGHLNIALTADQPGAFLQPDLLHEVERLEAFTESLPHVGGTHSPAGWIKRAHQKMNADGPEFYAIPDDPDETRFYLDVLGVETSPMARLLHEVIDDTYSRVNLIVRMTSTEYVHQRTVIHALQAYLDEHFASGELIAQIAGRANLDYHWLGLIRRSHINSVTLSFACVLLLTGLMFRSLVAGLLCTLTVGVAVLINYAVMGLTDIPLGVGTSMFASIAIGAGVNFPIHMLDRLRLGLRQPGSDPATVFRAAFAFTGRALFFTAFIVAAGFLLLCVSEFRTLVRFGLLIGIGMLTSFLTSVTLLPAIAAALRPRFLYRPLTASRRL